MFNLIKAEIYQLKTRTSPKIWLFLALLVGFFIAIFPQFIILLINNPIENGNFSLSAENPESGLEGYSIASHIYIGMEVIIGLAALILFLMAYISFNQELKKRSIINPLIVGFSRRKIYLSKYISAITASFAFFFVLIISFSSFNLIINGGTISQYFDLIIVKNLLPSIPVWLMWLAFYMILLFISDSEYTFVIYTVIQLIISQLVDFMSNHVSFVENIRPYLFYNLNGMSRIMMNDINIVPIISYIYIIIFLTIGISIFNRKEIK